MGLIGGLIKCLFKWTVFLFIISAILIILPGIPPYVKFTAREQPKQLIIDLTPENTLKSSSREFVGKLDSPEAFQVFNGELYTTLATGELVKLTPPGHVTFVTKIGQPCEGPWQMEKCGRPLGFRIDEAGKYVYIVDAYYGIWKVDLKTDKKQQIVPNNVEIAGRTPKLFNSVAIAKNGDLFWTESSSDFPLHDGVYTTLADPSGRLFHYDAAKKTNKVLLDGLWFANGVAISPDEQFVIVCETLMAKLWKVYINGPKIGQQEIFVDALPGVPDNIQPLPDKSGVLVGLYSGFDGQSPVLSHTLMPLPLVRKLAARVMTLIETPFEFLNQQFPHYAFQMITHKIGHFSSMKATLPAKTGFARIDWSGKIVGVWFLNDKSTEAISDAIVFNNKLYLGSPINNYIGVTEAPESLIQAFKPLSVAPPKKNAETMTEKIPHDNGKPKVQARAPVEEPKVVKIGANKVEDKPKTASPKVETSVKKEEPKPIKKEEPKPIKKEEPKPVKKEEPKPVKKEEPKPVKKEEPKIVKKEDTPPPVKPVETKTNKPKIETPQKAKENVKREEIPVKEEIKVDAQKPVQKPLKVITKDGPAVIPNPTV